MQIQLEIRGRFRIEHHSNAPHGGRNLLQHFDPFAAHRKFERGEARDIAARARQTLHKALAHRIRNRHEYDRYSPRLPLERRQAFGGTSQDDIGCQSHQFGYCGLGTVRLICCPAIVDVQVAALGPAKRG